MWRYGRALKCRTKEHFHEHKAGDIGKGSFNGLMCHPESFGIPTENNQETLVM